ncbi:MAG: hypothetical protein A2161_17800 [Candidatus Schekmanbacteria bacterium RBG_13_48_7]|uniref:PPM-type phosphatase domain-containing protein n=1 Tax=Candidatus Schekmanbacteria bacterium RBG_13_48_7 TaxID=1817878 RepID=A0A1F7S7Q0_9BACT|nr:MAG: hypothetical protein A2161_17800 [Candidatus Schekmanbacteria bacterium RBG_13_48_7]
MKIFYSGRTEKAKNHSVNHNYFKIAPEGYFCILTDASPMGKAGFSYSRTAAEGLERFLKRQKNQDPLLIRNYLVKAFQYANLLVLESLNQAPSVPKAGCMACVCLFQNQKYYIGVSGNIRCYLIRNHQLQRIFFSQSKSWMINDDGSMLLVGQNDQVSVGLDFGQVLENDCFLFLSDGVYKTVSEEIFLQVITKSETIHEAAQKLVQQACESNGTDDATALIMFIDSLQKRKFFRIFEKVGKYVPIRVLTISLLVLISIIILFQEHYIFKEDPKESTAVQSINLPMKFEIKRLPSLPDNSSSTSSSSLVEAIQTPSLPIISLPEKPVTEIIMELYQAGIDQLNPVNNNLMKANYYFKKMLSYCPGQFSVYIRQFNDPAEALHCLNRGIVKKMRGFLIIDEGKYIVFSGIYKDQNSAEIDLDSIRKIYQSQTVSVILIRQIL